MSNIESLEKERDKIMCDSLLGKKMDFTKLREICEKNQGLFGFQFNISSTDEDLWKSVQQFFKKVGM